MASIQAYNWPGNIRELENMLERVTYLMPKSSITVDDLPLELQQIGGHVELSGQSTSGHSVDTKKNHQPLQQLAPDVDTAGALKERSSNAEIQAIVKALDASDGQITRAAVLLGISRTTLWRKMAKYDLTSSHEGGSKY